MQTVIKKLTLKNLSDGYLNLYRYEKCYNLKVVIMNSKLLQKKLEDEKSRGSGISV
jgi:hypothetical protein